MPWLSRYGVQVSVLRTDKVHPVVSGNKWFKLKYYLEEANRLQKKDIVTYGGAYSNHLVATAAACQQLGFKSIGVIRGEEPKHYSHTLKDALGYGMALQFISREQYRRKQWPNWLTDSGFYHIPTGGYGPLGVQGAATIPYEKDKFDTLVCAVGTGTMLAGLMNGKAVGAKVVGISMFKNNFSLEAETRALLTDTAATLHLVQGYHFGGYARFTPELLGFMNDLYAQTGVPTDFVYTGKLFYAVADLIEKRYFSGGERVLVVHCGGLQGNLSLPKGQLNF